MSTNDEETYLIIGGVHGNEPCGAQAIRELAIEKEQVRCVIANEEALRQNKRYVDKDLNRSFEEKEEKTNEGKEAEKIKKEIDKADYVLDLHSSKTKTPYAICREEYVEIAQKLPVKKIVIGLEKLHKGSTDEYAAKQGKAAVCVECGEKGSEEAVEVAKKSIESFIGKGVATEKEIWKAVRMHTSDEAFEPNRQMEDFTLVRKGELMGLQGGKEVYTQTKGCVLFVNERKEGGECWVECERNTRK